MNVMFGLFNLGGGEIILILALVLILFGAKKLPELAKGLGTGIKEFKKATRDVTEEMHSAMEEQPVLTHGSMIAITVSVGTAILAPRLNTEKDALAAADTALYRAKGAGRNQVVSCDPEMQFQVTNQSNPQ